MPRRSKEQIEAEAIEAAWYASPAGRRQTQREFERALKDGTLHRSTGANIPRTDPRELAALVEQAKAKATKAISIRLPLADLESAQQLAARQGIGYQTLLKRIIHQALKKAS